MIDKKKVLRIVVYILLAIAILAVVMPVIIGAGYTYPCEDDFSYEAGGRKYASAYGNVLGALVAAYDYYVSWQGTYVPNFLLFFVRAYDRWGMIGLHVIMVTVVLLFVLAIFLLVKTLIKDRLSMLILALAAYVIAFNTSFPGREKEFFYWYTGSLTYALEFSFSCITLALALRLKDEENRKRIYYLAIISSITGFLASGGTLEVTSFNCSWLLLMLILCYKEIPKKKVMVVPFGVSFAGALINACAKGNFVRSNITMGELHYGITDALKDTFLCWENEWNTIFENKLLIVLFFVVFIVCLVCKTEIFKKGISTGKMLLLIPASFAIQYFTAFPVVLGYHGSALIYGRTTYTYELLTKLMILFVIISFAQWLREHIKLTIFVPVGAAALIIMFVIANNNIFNDVSDGFSYNAAKELKDGTIQELYEFRLEVLTLMEQSEKNTDVYLKVPNVPSSVVMYGMGITSDPQGTCNKAAAGYFELNSLAVEYSDEYEFHK